jgi:proteasome accessory factor B
MAQRKTERLLSLIALLLKRSRPVSKAEIRQGIPDYRQASAATFDRTFERDKRELREMGIIIHVRAVEDNREIADPREAARYRAEDIGYAIDREEYYLPQIDFTPEEWAILSLAYSGSGRQGKGAEAVGLEAKMGCLRPGWGGAGVGEKSQAFLAGLAGSRPDAGRERRLLGVLQEAIGHGRRLKLDYYAIERNQRSKRTVDPYLLAMSSGMWYLIGYCHLRKAVRTFKVSRIRSARPFGTDDSFVVPDGFDGASYLERKAWEFPVHDPLEVVISVNREEAWLVRHQLGGRARWSPDGHRASVLVSNRAPFVRWACANCDRAKIESPKDMAEEIGALLERVEGRYRHG